MFGFPKTDHTNYSKNFLKTVVFQIAFQENSEIISRKSEVFDLFQETFPRTNENTSTGVQLSFNPNEKTSILEPIEVLSALDLKSQDGQKIINITSTNLTVTYIGAGYSTFE